MFGNEQIIKRMYLFIKRTHFGDIRMILDFSEHIKTLFSDEKCIKKEGKMAVLLNFRKRSRDQSNRFFSSSVIFSNPGFPSRANIFFLYASTPGWSNGFTPSRYPERAQANS